MCILSGCLWVRGVLATNALTPVMRRRLGLNVSLVSGSIMLSFVVVQWILAV